MILFKPFKSTYLILFLLLNFQLISCAQKVENSKLKVRSLEKDTIIKTGAERTELYLELLKGKNVAVVANQTSIIELRNKKQETRHLVDTLISLGIDIKKVFAPEHGFRGQADAGELFDNSTDKKTGLPILSLHGKHKKPSQEQLKNIDIVVFDIQDVGVRFYTYISTLHYVMEACSEAGIQLIILDRPNPNGSYIDGPTLEPAQKSFLGMHSVPLVYGMTIGEYGKMINGEKWLENNLVCNLTVIPLKNYHHNSTYNLPIKPSPNLPNNKSINLYPSLGLFEGTNINAGRGTEFQFQRFGAPFLDKSKYTFSYTPVSNPGAKHPKHENILCYGIDLSDEKKLEKVNLQYVINAYKNATDKTKVFNSANFAKHAGTEKLQQQIEQGLSEVEIRKTWLKDLEAFKKIREHYLMYE
ncbi:MAG: DUF1343 domain-containing protein [Polaribacter sp.]|uniref:exo-beta-N-acetylmuramidase NamZ family protein n=1 Tax=Polaribacter sp. TaxID=1920175 RepID=UPI003BAE259E